MASQPALDDLAQTFQLKLNNERGQQFAWIDGVDYLYEKGLWRAMDAQKLPRFETWISDLARDRGIDYAAKMQQIWKTLRTKYGNRENVTFDAKPMLVCNNGTVDLLTSELLEHSPDHWCTRAADIDFDPEATCPEWLAMLERIFQGYPPEEAKQYIEFMQEFYGVSIVGDEIVRGSRDLRRALLLYGVGGSGKTTLAETLKTMLGGDDHIVSSNLSGLGSQFGLETFLGKRGYIADDGIDSGTKVDTKQFKKLVTGETITVDRKYQTAVNFRFQGPVIFTTNEIPSFSDNSDGTYGRMIAIETLHVFTAAEKRKLGKIQNVQAFLKKKKEFPGILNWALEGYDRIVKRIRTEGKGFILPQSARDVQTAMRERNDAVFDFLRNHCEYDPKVANTMQAVALGASEFSAQIHFKKRTRHAVFGDVQHRIREVHPEVNVEKVTVDGFQTSMIGGLRIKESGLHFLKAMSDRDISALSAYKSANARR